MTRRNPSHGPNRVAAAGLLLGTILLAGCGEPPPEDRGASTTDKIAALDAITLAGDSVSLEALRGQVVLLNVWATWCVPCRQEVPELQALHQVYADSGLHVVGVTVDNRAAQAQIQAFIERFGMTYDIWWDPDGTAIDIFGAIGVPLTILIDRDGRIAWRHEGAFTADDPAVGEAVRGAL